MAENQDLCFQIILGKDFKKRSGKKSDIPRLLYVTNTDRAKASESYRMFLFIMPSITIQLLLKLIFKGLKYTLRNLYLVLVSLQYNFLTFYNL